MPEDKTYKIRDKIKNPSVNGSLTLMDIARETKIPESTLRSWRDRFAPYIPTTGNGRTKRYPSEVREIFLSIKELYDEGLPTGDVAKRISQLYPIQTEKEETTSQLRRNIAEAPGQGAVSVITDLLKTQREILLYLRQLREAGGETEKELLKQNRDLTEKIAELTGERVNDAKEYAKSTRRLEEQKNAELNKKLLSRTLVTSISWFFALAAAIGIILMVLSVGGH